MVSYLLRAKLSKEKKVEAILFFMSIWRSERRRAREEHEFGGGGIKLQQRRTPALA